MNVKKIRLDETDRSLLNKLQAEFPLSREPFADIASSIGLDEKDVIRRIIRLKNEQIIRNIGPIFDSRSLGYQSTLVAMRVPPSRLEQAAQLVSQYPGVSHNYQRRHYYNLWFTLAVPAGTELKNKLDEINDRIKPKIMFDLPVVKLFKIRTFFNMKGNGHSTENIPDAETASSLPSPLEWELIGELQQDIPLISRPFDAMAKQVGLDVNDLLDKCQSLKDRGIMRRFGASLRHTNAGFASNAMVGWIVPRHEVDDVGFKMASFSEVSHCYERRTNPQWPYNVFTMVHGRTKKECLNTVERISGTTGIKEYAPLFTVREFKKERVKYKAENTVNKGSRYYPVFLDIKDKRCVVIGGGEVALRKVRMLLECMAAVEVISPALCPDLSMMVEAGAVKATLREYKPGDLDGSFVVVAATDDSNINKIISDEANEKGILINVVDVPRLSNFIVPSYLRRGDVTIAISTGGKSPALARKIRLELENSFGEEYAALAVLIDEVRSELRKRGTVLSSERWQRALDIDKLLELLKLGRREEARSKLMETLGEA